MLSTVSKSDLVLEICADLGFDLAGIAPCAPPPRSAAFDAWLAQGRHGEMHYLAEDRDRIVEPRRLLPEGRSIVALGLAHSRAALELSGSGRVARYAAGRDYHNVLGHKLRKLAKRLARDGLGGRNRRIVDAGPLLERSHAAVAGIGFESKAANLLHPRFGPWFFLAEVVLEHDLDPTTAPVAGSCGTCTACIDACPTQAIVAPFEVDARRCISYQTIEHRGVVPVELRAAHGAWAFGCDVCSEVCPWGRKAPDTSERYGTHAALASVGLVEWLERAPAFVASLGGSALHRQTPEGLSRNAAIALGNAPSDLGRRALLRALSFDPSQIVREAAAWALDRGHRADAGTREALEAAARREPEPGVREAMQRWAVGEA